MAQRRRRSRILGDPSGLRQHRVASFPYLCKSQYTPATGEPPREQTLRSRPPCLGDPRPVTTYHHSLHVRRLSRGRWCIGGSSLVWEEATHARQATLCGEPLPQFHLLWCERIVLRDRHWGEWPLSIGLLPKPIPVSEQSVCLRTPAPRVLPPVSRCPLVHALSRRLSSVDGQGGGSSASHECCRLDLRGSGSIQQAHAVLIVTMPNGEGAPVSA
jgi:hypothetical protein